MRKTFTLMLVVGTVLSLVACECPCNKVYEDRTPVFQPVVRKKVLD